MNYKKIYSRVKLLITQPQTEWHLIKDENIPFRVLLTKYIAPLILLFIATSFLSRVLFSDEIEKTFAYRIINVISDSIITFIGIYVSTLIINEIVPRFSTIKDQNKTSQLVIYSLTPYLLFLIVSGLLANYITLVGFLNLFSLYGIYLLWLGCSEILGISESNKLNFVIISVLIIIGVFALLKISAHFVLKILFIASAVNAM